MAVKTLSIEKLPQQFRDLVEFHDSLEKIYSFMIKRKMTVTVSKVEKIYRELVQTDKPISIVDNIFDLCTYCPDAYKLRLCDRILPTSSFDLELSFPIFSSATKIHAQKRHSYLLCRLSGLAVKYFVLWLKCADSKLAAKYSNAQQIVKEVNNSSWPPDFHFKDLNNAFETLATSELKELRRRLYSQNLASPEPHLDGGFGLSSTDHSTTNSSNINVQSTSLEDNGGAEGVLDYLKCQPFYKDQIKHVEQVPAREARYGVLAPPAIPSILQQRLQEALGLQQLYLHQAKAIDALRAGKHTVISTSTASGKSVIYNIPVLEAVLQDPSVTALYLFPTKVCTAVVHQH